MKTIIHDLDESYDSLFQSKCENVIRADGRYASCQGVLDQASGTMLIVVNGK